jgi:hypothetical protein
VDKRVSPRNVYRSDSRVLQRGLRRIRLW